MRRKAQKTKLDNTIAKSLSEEIVDAYFDATIDRETFEEMIDEAWNAMTDEQWYSFFVRMNQVMRRNQATTWMNNSFERDIVSIMVGCPKMYA